MATIEETLHAIATEYDRLGVGDWVRAKRITAASEAEVLGAKAKMACTLPEDYRQFLLCNTIAHSFDGNFEALSVAGMQRRWTSMTDLLNKGTFDDGRAARIQDPNLEVWWSAAWIPFAEDSCGNIRCIDLAPGPGEGRIIFMEVQDGQGPFSSPFPSFRAFLLNHLELLRTNKVRVEDGWLEVDSYI